MMIRFKTLFTLAIRHAYYSEACRDFDFLFPADSARRLENGKLLAKAREGKLHLLYEADEAGTPLISLAGQTVRIGLKLLNPIFSNLTDTGPGPAFLLYRNAADRAKLDAAEKRNRVGPIFTHFLTDTARPTTATLKEAGGGVVQTDEVTAADGRSSLTYDLTGRSAGAYRVEELSSGGAATVLYYSDPELSRLGAFGAVEVAVDGGFYAAPPAFEIAFDAREETVKYYLVARNYTAAEFSQLSVLDAGFAEEGRPPLTFTKVDPAAFTADEIPPALLGGPDDRVVLFKSQAAVARREKPRKKIQLKKNGDVLIPHLPQPGEGKPNAEMIIQISKP
ncbi:MAG TPA: hypothetical protein VFA47_01565 [Candidatus Manganitrophaceae bacterium]|nr:hypothetical protein [Candidatus Manganitrophaceae bacterium]